MDYDLRRQHADGIPDCRVNGRVCIRLRMGECRPERYKVSELEYSFEEFKHWFRMEVLTREFPEVPAIKLLMESMKYGELTK